MSEVREHRLDNGLILLVEELNRPAAACQMVLPGGTSLDPDGGEGAGAMLSTLIERGAGDRNTRELSEAFENLGYRWGVSGSQNSFVLSLTGLVGEFGDAFGMLCDVIRRPALPEKEVEPVRQLALQRLRGLEDDPAHKLLVHVTERYFPSRYGRSRYGTEAGLKSLGREDLVAQWQQAFVPAGAILGVAGGLPFDEVVRRVEDGLGDWTGNLPDLPEPETDGRPAYDHIPHESEQVHLAVAYPQVPPGDDDWYRALMAVQVLSGGMGSRLFTEVREKRGLCYSVHARHLAVPSHGYVMATAGTTTERSSETLAVMAEVLRGLPGSVQEDEVERGRVRLLSSLIMSDESTSRRAARMVGDQHLLGRVRSFEEVRDGIEAVTVDSLNEYLSRRAPREFTVVTLGPKFDWPAGLDLEK